MSEEFYGFDSLDFDEDVDYDGDPWCGDCGKCEDCLEIAMGECGMMPDGGCMLAGTEHCDWDCPFSGEDNEDEEEFVEV